MSKDLEALKRALEEEIEGIWRMVLDSDIGINNKTGTNTLSGSNLYKEIETKSEDDFTFHLYYNFYAEYVERGRPSVDDDPTIKKVPVGAIIEWMKRKLHTSDARVAFAIRESIYKKGITGRPILVSFQENIDKAFDKWASMIIESILSDISKFFK